ncbi:MAG: TonB-dependent receptor [Gemmatimonadota bacterium]
MGRSPRIPYRAHSPALFCILLFALPLGAQERGDDRGGVANAHIVGTVIDHESGAPLGTVRVVLEDSEGEETWSGVTDVRGRFRITLIPSGNYEISFSRLAYRTATEPVPVQPEGEVNMRVELIPEAVELEPVVVTTSRRSPLQRVGFYDRQRAFHGEFFLREDIEDQNAITVPELVRMNPAFHVTGTTPETVRIVSLRGGLNLVPGQDPCPPAVFLDGMLLESDPWTVARPENLAAMEVYAGLMTPAQFYTRGGCGAIVMWTIQEAVPLGEPKEGGRDRRYLFATIAGVLATLHVLIR